MKTSHINHVVLYAKDFYRHTGDIIKDMQRFTQLDGHKFWEVKTPDKLLKVMRADYLKWAESLDDDDENKKDMLDEVDDVVAWERGVAAHIWRYIIIYQNHILRLYYNWKRHTLRIHYITNHSGKTKIIRKNY